jgi:hypothetical protein
MRHVAGVHLFRYRLHTTHGFGQRLIYKNALVMDLVKTRGKFLSDPKSQISGTREHRKEFPVHTSVSKEPDNYLVLIDIAVAICQSYS